MGDNQHHANYSIFSPESSREETLEFLLVSYESLAKEQTNWVCNLANAASLIWHAYKALQVNVNWAGFYVTDKTKQNELILGPFQGKPACQTIIFGKGVCGTAASTQRTQLIPDVNKFPGHIACDGETKSEIVVPILDLQTAETLAVIDLDCLDFEGFNEIDQKYLEKLAILISKTCKF
ncbi:L-methionine (R)-S-oxide reductase NDAI_0C00400 [Naumovozyma dairenensis CBS 421]|uniref:GAF domain-containing protein n=1 Tax=Naumovozyma dairenensis (strain ATCC 10597 / BCRC 20456 / CBS 421 / NBRC 0211 / NRRL Y-12639) TaxID=1071378 RepID=G0W7E0_NAUDC|nr:hypothetical protein NDAI_0C00400 [Naumovozyma dairenensis CBS 421]CCD23701.1 hypothetical protein NDAI_0C00400 [Naumovozyma dairenensis CBS 421]